MNSSSRPEALPCSSPKPHVLIEALAISLLAILFSGCNAIVSPASQSGANTNSGLVLSASSSLIRLGGTSTLNAVWNGTTNPTGSWGVLGGTANGVIDGNGIYHAPNTMPSPTQITAVYSKGDQSSQLPLSLLNPIPTINSVTPAVIVATPTLLTVTGSGFVPGSMIFLGSTQLQTSYVDSQHVTGTVSLTNPANTTVALSVANPDPGASTSYHIQVALNLHPFTVSPQALNGGDVTITWSGSDIPADAVVVLDGKSLTTTSISPSSITATGYLVPWKTGTSDVQLVSGGASVVLADQITPINGTAASFDQAARFSTQAAFGPRPDVVNHIQQVGLSTFITEQLSQAPVLYDPTQDAMTQFSQQATSGPSLLRLRLAWSLQNFITTKTIDREFSFIPFEQMLERDCSGNFRDLLTDVASDPSVGFLLNLAGNVATTDPTQTPNQNFARELMQLFTLGPNLLNEDGSVRLDAQGNVIPTYTQAQVIGLSRVFTGWNYPPPVNKDYTSYYGIDLSQPLQGIESQHDEQSKTIVGGTVIPAAQGIGDDRRLALDAIFLHPNLPPFISHLLIQHLVKSAPTPSYIRRVAQVFENDGTGTRGNLTAVVKAILLDPEARAGDITASQDDGFLQEPLLFQMFAISLTQTPLSDSQTNYWGGTLGQAWWGNFPSVFGYYRPDNTIPGTNVISPEYQILTNQNIIVRSQYLWGIVSGTAPGLNYNPHSWLLSKFTTLPDFIDAIDHLAFHGTMPAYEKAAILTYCQKLDPTNQGLQFQRALFLALNSDHYTVSH